MDLKAEIQWIEKALSESKDPTVIAAVKHIITSMQKIKEDMLMSEAENDILAGRVYDNKEAHKIVDDWEL